MQNFKAGDMIARMDAPHLVYIVKPIDIAAETYTLAPPDDGDWITPLKTEVDQCYRKDAHEFKRQLHEYIKNLPNPFEDE